MSTSRQAEATQYSEEKTYFGKVICKLVTDAENRSVSFEYDAAGRVTRQVLPDTREVVYGYDANGNVTSITPPGRPAHVFNYNAFDLEGQYTPPAVAGITTPQTVYDYNLDKELVKITRPDNQEINFNYNNGAQLQSLTTEDTGGTETGRYSYTYLPVSGQLDTITSPDNIVLDYDYDGFLVTNIEWSGAVSGSVGLTYNNNFQITSQCVNLSSCVSFQYDNDGLLIGSGGLVISRDTQRGGLPTETALGDLQTTQNYNAFGELEVASGSYDTTSLYSVLYQRDDLGRITQKAETVAGNSATESYGYDTAGRLTSVTRDGVITSYVYDSNGNRLNKTTGSNVETGVYDAQDRLTSYNSCAYSYTDNGELQTTVCGTETTQYVYDAIGNLVEVTQPDSTVIEYLIDGQNRRVGKRVNGTLIQQFIYGDRLNPIAELDGAGNLVSRFVYGDMINVPAYLIRSGITYRVLSNYLGSPLLVVNESDGSIAQQLQYDEFGNVLVDTNEGFTPFGFAGGIYDPDTGLVRFGARDYDSTTGRWTTKDPIKFDGGLNHYGYVHNNPISWTDPSGLGPTTFYVCTAGNAAYAIGSFLDTMTTIYNTTALLRDQLNRVNKEIKNCPSSDIDRLKELFDIRNDLIEAQLPIASELAKSNTKLGLGEAGNAMISEGVCGLLWYAPTP